MRPFSASEGKSPLKNNQIKSPHPHNTWEQLSTALHLFNTESDSLACGPSSRVSFQPGKHCSNSLLLVNTHKAKCQWAWDSTPGCISALFNGFLPLPSLLPQIWKNMAGWGGKSNMVEMYPLLSPISDHEEKGVKRGSHFRVLRHGSPRSLTSHPWTASGWGEEQSMWSIGQLIFDLTPAPVQQSKVGGKFSFWFC